MITVIETKGSSPRDAGARMIWTPEDGFFGTVGGGQFEHMALDAAASYFEKQTTGIEHYVLGTDADQCCGGTMDVFFEYVGTRERIVIFGAGHVSYELAKLLEAAPARTVIVDDRADWNNTERFPTAERILSFDEGVATCHAAPESTFVVVMTCSHDTDFEILRQLLPTPPAFVGLIGSRSKRVCLFGRLVASGLDETTVQSVQCPVGVGDTGKEPPLVAVSIAAKLLVEVRKRVERAG